MKSCIRIFSTAVVLFGLAACSGVTTAEINALNNTAAVGSPFTKYLAAEYKAYTAALQPTSQGTMDYVRSGMLRGGADHVDAISFSRKGLAAASGDLVMPEALDDWNLSDKNISEMAPARSQLIEALENGGREVAPDKAAVAQARFDCWVEQQEQNWDADVPCKKQFWDALNGLLPLIKPPALPVEPMPAPVTEAAPAPAPVPLEQAMFIVFFDWDKYILSSGEDVLDAVAAEVKKRKDGARIVIVGHADTSGSEKYNMKLSQKRANTVRDGLVARGIDGSMIRIEARGESELLVKTPDNVREPANRRAQITLE